MNFLESIANYFDQIGNQIYQILLGVDQTLQEFQAFFEIAKIYVAVSGIVLLIILIMQLAAISVAHDCRKEVLKLRDEIRALGERINTKEEEQGGENEQYFR